MNDKARDTAPEMIRDTATDSAPGTAPGVALGASLGAASSASLGATLGVARLAIGGLPAVPGDPAPSPAICISYPCLERASEAADIVMSLQNGTRPLPSGNAVYMGDTAFKVHFSSRGKRGQVLCEVFAKYDRRHLTCGFYAAETVSVEELRPFWQLMEIHRSFVLTVGSGDTILQDRVYIVKYIIRERGDCR